MRLACAGIETGDGDRQWRGRAGVNMTGLFIHCVLQLQRRKESDGDMSRGGSGGGKGKGSFCICGNIDKGTTSWVANNGRTVLHCPTGCPGNGPPLSPTEEEENLVPASRSESETSVTTHGDACRMRRPSVLSGTKTNRGCSFLCLQYEHEQQQLFINCCERQVIFNKVFASVCRFRLPMN